MFKAVVFDIDGTLTRNIAWVYLTKTIGGSIEYNDTTIASWDRGEITGAEAEKRLVENWSKGGKNTKKDWKEILRRIPLREDAKETVEYVKSKGYNICMITGAFDVYAEVVGEELGITDWYANSKLIWNDNGELAGADVTIDDKSKKIEQFKLYCESKNFKPKECVPVGDSSNDMGLFEITGNGIAVRTEFEALELEKIAWKKIDHLIELKSIL